MKSKTIDSIACVVVLAIMISGTTCLAQTVSGTAGAASDTTLQEVIVTASKRPEDANTVPTAITVLGGTKLEEQGATQFTDYFNQVPGLSAVSAGQPGHDIVSLRGISTGASQTSATVGYYLDDVPFGSSGSLAIGGILVPDPDLFDVNRVEVLKGPQGTLYGASTLGGLIKVVRNEPDPTGFSARIAVDASSVDGGGDGYGIRAMLNAPLSDTTALRVNVNTRRDPGFIDDVNLGIKNENFTDVSGGRLAFLYKPIDRFSVELSAYTQEIKDHGINQTDLDPTTLQPTVGDLKTAENYIRPGDDLKYQVYAAKIEYDLHFATLTSITSYGTYDDHSITDLTDNIGFGPVIRYNQELKLDKTTEEARLVSPSDQPFEWLVGGFYTHESNHWPFQITGLDNKTLQPLVPAFNFYTFDAFTQFKEESVFATGTYHLTKQFSVVAGGRYSENSQDYSYARSGIAPGGYSLDLNSSSDHAFTYESALQWEPVDRTMAYFRVASGYRPGGPQVSNLQGLGLPNTYQPDTVVNYELGLKTTQLEDRLQFDLATFYIDWSKLQLLDNVVLQTPEGVVRRSLIANAGKASSRGVELNMRYRPLPGLTMSASTAYTDAYLNTAAPALGASAGERIPYVPTWSGLVDADYRFPVVANLTGIIGGTARYVGDRFNYFSQDPGGTRATIPSYTQLDIRGGVLYSTWNVTLRLNNVANKRGIIGAQTNAFENVPPFAPKNDTGVYIQPRTVGLEITKSF